MINRLFDDLDFTKLKLPIEPKHLIYVFLAYKLINNLDKLHIDTPRPHFPKPPNPMPSVLMLLITLFSFYILFGNMTSQMFVRNIEPTKIYVSDNKSKQMRDECNMINKCPIRSTDCPIRSTDCPIRSTDCPIKMSKCPLRMCPLYANSEDLKELMDSCITSKKNKELTNKKTDSDDMKSADSQDNKK